MESFIKELDDNIFTITTKEKENIKKYLLQIQNNTIDIYFDELYNKKKDELKIRFNAYLHRILNNIENEFKINLKETNNYYFEIDNVVEFDIKEKVEKVEIEEVEEEVKEVEVKKVEVKKVKETCNTCIKFIEKKDKICGKKCKGENLYCGYHNK